MEDTKVNKILSQSWTLDIKLKGSWEHNKAKYPLVGGGGGVCMGKMQHREKHHDGRVQRGSLTVVKTMGSGARQTKV